MATLKSLVDETGNIKNELAECHANLKNNLIAKGVECGDNDKMSSFFLEAKIRENAESENRKLNRKSLKKAGGTFGRIRSV